MGGRSTPLFAVKGNPPMTVHILDMTRSPIRSLCGMTEFFAVSMNPDKVDCVVCLDLDDVARREAHAAHPSGSSPSDQERG